VIQRAGVEARVGGGLVLRHAKLGSATLTHDGRPFRIRQGVGQCLPGVALRVALREPAVQRSIRVGLVMPSQHMRELMTGNLREHRLGRHRETPGKLTNGVDVEVDRSFADHSPRGRIVLAPHGRRDAMRIELRRVAPSQLILGSGLALLRIDHVGEGHVIRREPAPMVGTQRKHDVHGLVERHAEASTHPLAMPCEEVRKEGFALFVRALVVDDQPHRRSIARTGSRT
jgi:hypothetical protein